MAKTSVINHISGAKYIKLFEDFIAICAYQVSTEVKGTVIKHNNCAAALLAFYEHRHNGILSAHGDKKTAVNLKQESSNSFLEKCLLFHYSQKTIKEANEFLENEGFITIFRNRISDKENAPNDILLNIDAVNYMLREYCKIMVGENYPTLILPNPYRKITIPPTVKLPYPYGNFTESNNKENDNVNNNHNNRGENTPTTENEIVSFNALEEKYDGVPFSENGMNEFEQFIKEKGKKEKSSAKKEKKVSENKPLQECYSKEDFFAMWELRLSNNDKLAIEFRDIDAEKLYDSMLNWSVNKGGVSKDWYLRGIDWVRKDFNRNGLTKSVSDSQNNKIQNFIDRHLKERPKVY